MKIASRFLISLALVPLAFAASTRTNIEYLNKLYQDLLHRTPSSTELSMLSVVLDAKGDTAVVNVITASREFRTDELRGYYGKFLNRQPSDTEISALIGLLFNGQPNDDVKSVILSSDEYYRHVGASPSSFLMALYQDVLGRPIDSAAAFTFETMLRNGTPRGTIVLVVLKSSEAHTAVIRGYYQRFLRRDPHSAETASFLPILTWGGQDSILIGLLCSSDEYFKR